MRVPPGSVGPFCSGGIEMSGSAVPEANGPSDVQGRIIALLTEALDILDTHDWPPEIGARLQEVISAVEAEQSAKN